AAARRPTAARETSTGTSTTARTIATADPTWPERSRTRTAPSPAARTTARTCVSRSARRTDVLLVGLDVGTSALKAIAIRADTGDVVASASREYPLHTDHP